MEGHAPSWPQPALPSGGNQGKPNRRARSAALRLTYNFDGLPRRSAALQDLHTVANNPTLLGKPASNGNRSTLGHDGASSSRPRYKKARTSL